MCFLFSSYFIRQDAKLKEVAELIKDSSAEAAKADTVLHFSRVYPDLKYVAFLQCNYNE